MVSSISHDFHGRLRVSRRRRVLKKSPPEIRGPSEGATMHHLTIRSRRGILTTASASAILLTFLGSLHADDKSPRQILNGKPVITSGGSSRFYDGQGRFAGRTSVSGSTIRMYDRHGRATGRVEASQDSTWIYDRRGSFAGRSTFSGRDTKYYDRKGSFSRHSTTSGNRTRFYDRHGAYSGRAETSNGTTRYYDSAGRYVGRRTR
jgi:hypothetical protein